MGRRLRLYSRAVTAWRDHRSAGSASESPGPGPAGPPAGLARARAPIPLHRVPQCTGLTPPSQSSLLVKGGRVSRPHRLASESHSVVRRSLNRGPRSPHCGTCHDRAAASARPRRSPRCPGPVPVPVLAARARRGPGPGVRRPAAARPPRLIIAQSEFRRPALSCDSCH